MPKPSNWLPEPPPLLCPLPPKQVVLFIDEVHLVLGAGKTEGAMDAGAPCCAAPCCAALWSMRCALSLGSTPTLCCFVQRSCVEAGTWRVQHSHLCN
mgnify:CR=1 FL=1